MVQDYLADARNRGQIIDHGVGVFCGRRAVLFYHGQHTEYIGAVDIWIVRDA